MEGEGADALNRLAKHPRCRVGWGDWRGMAPARTRHALVVPSASGGGGNAPRGRARNMPRVQLGIRSTTDEGEPGIRVVTVREGLSAGAAGIMEGDRIILFNDAELETRRNLIDELMELEPGTTVKVKVIRDGKEMEIEIEMQGRGG